MPGSLLSTGEYIAINRWNHCLMPRPSFLLWGEKQWPNRAVYCRSDDKGYKKINKERKKNKRPRGGAGASLSRWRLSRDLSRERMRVSHGGKQPGRGGSMWEGTEVGPCLLGLRHSKEWAREGPGLGDKKGKWGSHQKCSGSYPEWNGSLGR